MKSRMHETKNSTIFNQNIKPRHYERSEESSIINELPGFFATLRMTKLTYLAILASLLDLVLFISFWLAIKQLRTKLSLHITHFP
ncbi:MAG: hypothetical protein PHO76_08670 [Methylotenera sp.]|nr:hypothetical protein [Methylotenera sp.]MDD4925244.1 hypothetical protein [Methylotenera sp.]